jgi:hypothetical protein
MPRFLDTELPIDRTRQMVKLVSRVIQDQFYQAGVVTSSNCGTILEQALLIVGYASYTWAVTVVATS